MGSNGKSTRSIAATCVPGTFLRRAGTFVPVVLFMCAGAGAETVSLSAAGDPNVPSFFTLDFGDAGGIASGHITRTNLEIEIDADRFAPTLKAN